jgi:OmpA-OmpF porin, OOP family
LGTHVWIARAALLAMTSCWLLAPSSAHAAEPGFAVDRFEPSERGSNFFVLESLDLRGHVRPAAGVIASYGYRPLVYRVDDEVRAAMVNHQLTTHVGGSLNLWNRVRVALNAPIVLYTEGQEGRLGTKVLAPPSSATTLGDIRLGVDARIAGEYGEKVTFALGAQLWLPTGSASAYTGDGAVRFGPRALVAGEVGPIAYAAKLGVAVRSPEASTYANVPLGSELVYGFGGGYKFLEGKGIVGPEFFGSTHLGDGAFKTRTSPLEVILGGRYEVAKQLRAGLGIGTGLVGGLGSPEVRIVGGVEWMMAPPKPGEAAPPVPPELLDTDGDGIPDKDDACYDMQGARTNDPRTNGCADRDGDGILDPLDTCPTAAGPANADPKLNGCPAGPPPPPPPDADGDGIPDKVDSCPNASGKPHKDPAKNGCPKLWLASGQIRVTVELPDDEEAMTQIAAILNDDTSIKRLRVEGHSDNRGDDKALKKESQDRAEAVTKWLTAHGVDKKRVIAVGIGSERPIESNDTDEGRAINRRIELYLERE